LYRGCKERSPQIVYTIEVIAGISVMVDVVIPYINQELASEEEQVELEDGSVVLIDPDGLVALVLHELGGKLVDVEPAGSEKPELPEAA
jgi:hypothetical protein